MKTPEYIRDFANDLVADSVMKRRNEIFYGIDRMVALDYEVPIEAKNIPGLHTMIRPDPAENIQIATNSVAGSMLQVHIDPVPGGNDRASAKNSANEKEQMVKWWLSKLDRRDEGSVLEKIANSAYRYNMVAFRTDHVNYVNRAKKRLKGSDEQQRAAYLSQGGPFGWQVYHPSCVYPLFSGLGLERILVAEVKPVHKVLDYYGGAAKKLETKLKTHVDQDSKWLFKFVTEFYYRDREMVYCWVVPGETTLAQPANSKDAVDIFKDRDELGFMNWVVKTSTTLDKGDNIRPMLYNAWKSGWWDSQNLVETLTMTTLIQNAGKPDWIHEGPEGDATLKPNYKHLVGGVLRVPYGHTVKETQPAVVDQALIQQSERLGNWQERTGASRALAGATTGEVYALGNLQVGIGQNTVESGKNLIEAALSAGALQCFQWAQVVGEELYVPAETELGRYTLNPQSLDIGSLYLSVTLKEGKPGGNIQINNAMAIAKQFGVSNRTALETAGYENPQAEQEQAFQEMLERVRVENQILIEQAMAQTQAQMLTMQAQIQMKQMQTASMQAAPQQPQLPTNEIYSNEQPMQALNPTGLPEGLGQGLNSNAGGIPPALLNPGATLEGQTGLTRTGQPVI